jgi:carboxyl-terminal processing protease
MHKPLLKRWLILSLACLLLSVSLPLNTVYATNLDDPFPPPRNHRVPDDWAPAALPATHERATDISASAGRLLGELIALIYNEYAGDPVTQQELLEAALYGISSILDPYSGYMNTQAMQQFTGGLAGRLTGVGVQIRMNESNRPEIMRVMPNTPAQEAGLRRGDIIISVNGRSTNRLSLDEVIGHIGDPAHTRAVLQVERDGKRLNFDMLKREIASTTVFTDSLEDLMGDEGKGLDHIRYVAVSSISNNTGRALQRVIEQLQREGVTKLILDLRGNAGGYLDVAIEIGNMLIPSGPVCFTVDNRGRRESLNSTLQVLPFQQVVVLVDEATASAAELIAAAMQDAGSGILVGETTYGKGVVQSIFNISGGGGLKLTTEEYLRRSGGKVNGIGVTPDYVVPTPRTDYETPRDKGLLKAVELLAG